MTRPLALALLLLAGCGSADDLPAQTQLSFALGGDIAAKAKSLQVAFVKNGTSVDCTSVRRTCLREAGLTLQPLAGSQKGRPVFQTPFDAAQAGDAGQGLDLEVAAGTYLLAVEALDDAGKLVANGCQLRVELHAGDSASAQIALGAYTGPACDARFP